MADTWKIMVLEDDPQLRDVLVSILQDEGYEVVSVDNGKGAVELASAHNFDLIVTDIRMDGVDGLEALRQARSYQPELSSLVVSGYTTEAETLRALQLNVGGFLKKPFSLNDFLQRVRELLSQRKTQTQQRESLLSLRHSLWWTLGAGVSSLKEEAREAGALAYYIARQLGLEDDQCQWCRLGTALSMLESGPLLEWPANVSQDQHGLYPIVQLVQEIRRGGGSLPAQIALVGRHLSQTEDSGLPEPPADWSWDEALQKLVQSEGEQLRHSPRVLASLASQDQALGVASTQRVHRSLLGLALTLEERGDNEAAKEAYRQLKDDGEAGVETRLQALVGSARVLFAQGDASYFNVLKEAETLSRGLGPLAGATQRWPIASLLLRSKHPSAENYLQQLEQEFQQLGLSSAWAKARVARASLNPEDLTNVAEAVRQLSSPANLGDVAGEASWLVPALLDLGARTGQPPGAWVCRLAAEFATHVRRWVADKTAATPGLDLLLKALVANPELAPANLTEALTTHPDPEVRRRVSALSGQGRKTFLRFRSFGCFEVFVNGERVPDSQFKTQKYKFLLAYLVARPGQAIPEEVLVEEFFPDSRGSGKASIYSATTTLRRCLRGGAKAEQAESEFILRESERLMFDGNVPLWHDLQEFEQAIAHEPPRATEARQAATLLTGPYLQGCYLDWAQRKRAQLDEASVRLFIHLAGDSRPQEALDYAQRGLDVDPTSQECHLLRMQAFMKLGQPEKAMKQFTTCQQTLRIELGIEPLTSLIELYYRAQLAMP